MLTETQYRERERRASERWRWLWSTERRIIGDLGKPFHRPECACDQCEHWRTQHHMPTMKELEEAVKSD